MILASAANGCFVCHLCESRYTQEDGPEARREMLEHLLKQHSRRMVSISEKKLKDGSLLVKFEGPRWKNEL